MAGKKDLVEEVYGAVEGITRRQAGLIVEAIFREIGSLLARGERVTISGFGGFSVTERPARQGRNPATGAPITIPAARNVRFRVPAALKEALSRPKPRTRTSFRRARPRPRRPLSDLEQEEPPTRGDVDMPGEAPPERGYHVVEVFYATDRKRSGSTKPEQRYGAARGDGSLAYGVCEVSIPEDHRVGRLEGPSWRRFEFRQDPEKHVVLLDLREVSGDRFFTDLSATLRKSPRNQILLFLHGFNVSFEDAARRTAQMAYDLRFEGAPAFYSWPSKGALAAYTHDEATVEWTIPHLKAFLQDLADRSGAEAIHLIAHSMGNRALTRALEQLAALMADPDAPGFSEVILTAPDIDADVFRQVAAAFRRAARRVTLYASERDRALLASHKVHGYPRAGDGGGNIVVVPGIDTIDASAVDTDLVGHFYYGDNRSVLSDVFYVLRGHAPQERSMLRGRRCPAGSYWAFVP
ncbi:MAG TPA: alpha/beta hydrolase [Thermoanaerobaculia bacterium]|nr:alpha/beta hydrolase [Thermoanaerobaculia bacterium]